LRADLRAQLRRRGARSKAWCRGPPNEYKSAAAGSIAVPTQERIMTTDPLDDYIAAVSTALGLSIDDAWKPAVRANLEVSLRLAALVDEFALPDETEPASVFTA
jgi:hypothetical protein